MSIQRETASVVEFQDTTVHSALAGLEAPSSDQPGLALREIWPFNATQVAWGKGADVSALAKALSITSMPMAMREGFAKGRSHALILPLMPGRVLRLAPTAPTKAMAGKLSELGAYLLDLSEGRTLLELQGPHWAWALRKGAGLDFDSFAPGMVAQTALFKVSTLIWMQEPGTVNLLVSYTYARALAEKIIDAAQDQGIAFAG